MNQKLKVEELKIVRLKILMMDIRGIEKYWYSMWTMTADLAKNSS